MSLSARAMLVQSALLLLGVALLHRAGVSWLAATPLALLAAFAALDADVFSSVVCALRYAPSQFSGQVVWITGASSGIGVKQHILLFVYISFSNCSILGGAGAGPE